MGKRFGILLMLFLSVALTAGALLAQSKDTGAIQGKVLDDQMAPLPGVTVMISSPKLMGTRSAVTDREGKFRFPPSFPEELTPSKPL